MRKNQFKSSAVAELLLVSETKVIEVFFETLRCAKITTMIAEKNQFYNKSFDFYVHHKTSLKQGTSLDL